MSEAIFHNRVLQNRPFAFISVSYPAGSVCTCTMGNKVLKAKNTGGSWVFAVPKAGTWTVTAADGTDTASKDVSITSEGQNPNVVLSYELVLFDNGVDNTPLTGGWIGASGNVITASVRGDSEYDDSWINVGTILPVNLTGYHTLCFTITEKGGWQTSSYVGAAARGYPGSSYAASVTPSVGTVSIDISKLSGSYHLWYSGKTHGVGNVIKVTITRVWLK